MGTTRRTDRVRRPPGGGTREARPCLTVHEGAEVGREYFLESGETLMGRAAESGIAIADTSVSRRHARLLVVPGDPSSCVLEDLGSTNGTFLNGRPVERAELRDGDRIRVGGVVLRFEWKGEESDRYTRRLYRAATHDPLTGALNRRQFGVRLAEACDRSSVAKTPLALLMVDIDHFKSVNDTHGHPAGDRVLQAVASTLREEAPEPDAVARYGGEEFAVILRGAGRDGALGLAEAMRRRVEGLAVDHEGSMVRVTVSVGIAAATGIEDPETLVRRADEALYAAKRSGRNRCCASEG